MRARREAVSSSAAAARNIAKQRAPERIRVFHLASGQWLMLRPAVMLCDPARIDVVKASVNTLFCKDQVKKAVLRHRHAANI